MRTGRNIAEYAFTLAMILVTVGCNIRFIDARNHMSVRVNAGYSR